MLARRVGRLLSQRCGKTNEHLPTRVQRFAAKSHKPQAPDGDDAAAPTARRSRVREDMWTWTQLATNCLNGVFNLCVAYVSEERKGSRRCLERVQQVPAEVFLT